MAQITPLWRSKELTVYRFEHPVEHEDPPYEAVAEVYRASFVEQGAFHLTVDDHAWRVGTGDVMLSHPGMRFRAGFPGRAFNDVCLSVVYETAGDDGFDPISSWAPEGRKVLSVSNRLRYLRWGLLHGLTSGQPMLTEYCASEIFRAPETGSGDLYSERKFAWYAERVHHIRERLDREYAEDLTVSDLARSVGMSLFHFTRVFTELVGQPPHRYLVRARLDAARTMLRGGASVTETCYACGFNNLSHFSRSFTRWFGENPSRLAS